MRRSVQWNLSRETAAIRDHLCWQTTQFWQSDQHFNITTPVTRDHLSWQITFLWPMGWSFKTGSTVSHAFTLLVAKSWCPKTNSWAECLEGLWPLYLLGKIWPCWTSKPCWTSNLWRPKKEIRFQLSPKALHHHIHPFPLMSSRVFEGAGRVDGTVNQGDRTRLGGGEEDRKEGYSMPWH